MKWTGANCAIALLVATVLGVLLALVLQVSWDALVAQALGGPPLQLWQAVVVVYVVTFLVSVVGVRRRL